MMPAAKMPERSPDPAIAACFAEFEMAVRRVATKLVREVLARELAAAAALVSSQRPTKRSVASTPPAGRGRRRPARPPTSSLAGEAERGVTGETPPAPAAQVPAAPVSADASAEAPPPPSSGPAPAADARRREWTRTRVVTELSDWLLQDPTIDAATLGRRGQGPLASWARRLFGRFDAALNAANLHIAELYPEGPPSRAKRAAAMT
jgi:hypothetical protein